MVIGMPGGVGSTESALSAGMVGGQLPGGFYGGSTPVFGWYTYPPGSLYPGLTIPVGWSPVVAYGLATGLGQGGAGPFDPVSYVKWWDSLTQDERNKHINADYVANPAKYAYQRGHFIQPWLKDMRIFQQIYSGGGIRSNTGTPVPYQQTSRIQQFNLFTAKDWYPNNCLLSIPNGDTIWCVNADDKCAFMILREDLGSTSGTFSKAYSFNYTMPMMLACNSDYIFGISSTKLFISPLPTYWTTPTQGTGAGTVTSLTSDRIISLKEQVSNDGVGRVVIDLENSDGAYNTPPATLKRGSRINVSLGYEISGEETTTEYARYFVEYWGDASVPNKRIFRIVASNGAGLLDKSIFGRNVIWNEWEKTKTVRSMITDILTMIGGTLVVVSCSPAFDAFSPYVSIKAGMTGLELLNQIMKSIDDVIYWYGNDAYVVYPKSTDTHIYNYVHPSP